MRPKFQKRSALKLAGRIIPVAKRSRINDTLEKNMDKRVGTITIIITNRTSQAENVNAILSEFGDVIIGRMGIPYSPKNLHIIALIVHASTDDIGALTGKLGALKGIQVKSVLTKA
jgi:putative iron-only hydrogenase system regulator